MTDFNDINGSSSALGEGSFKRRDELRRAEMVQRQKVKMGERLDRNINRAVRSGDSQSAQSFVKVRQAITGQAYGGSGGITSADDREQRVADGTLKGARARYDMGNSGTTNNGMITEAPSPDTVTPKNRSEWDNDGNGVPNSIQRPGIATPEAQGGLQAPPVAPSARADPGGLAAKRAAVGKLRDKWLGENKANDPDSLQAAYEKKNGTPEQQSGARSTFAVKPDSGQKYQTVGGNSEFESLTAPSEASMDFSVPSKIAEPIEKLGTASPISDFESLTASSKPSVAKRSSAVTPKEDLSEYEGQSALGNQFSEVVGDVVSGVLKAPKLMGEKVLQRLVPGYDDASDPDKLKNSQSEYAKDRVLDLTKRASQVKTDTVFGKTKKANLLKAAREFESTITSGLIRKQLTKALDDYAKPSTLPSLPPT